MNSSEPTYPRGAGCLRRGQPLSNQIAELQELVIRRWLAEIGLGAAENDPFPILGGIRGRDHNDGCIFAPMTLAQVLKDLDAMFLRQVNIQDYQVGTGRGVVAIRMVEEMSSFFAILDYMDLDLDSHGFDGFADQENVGRVILDDQDLRVPRRLLFEGW